MASKEDAKVSSSASSHRLPTVSASQALQQLRTRGPKSLSTGLKQLDAVLQVQGSEFAAAIVGGGLARGQVTEVYGAAGAGKTTFAAQICVNTLHDGHVPVWIDAGKPLVQLRFDKIRPTTNRSAVSSDSSSAPVGPQPRLQRIHTPTLAHLLALVVQLPASFPPANTSVIVIDGLSTLFDNAYPRQGGPRSSSNQTEAAKWASSRRFTVMNELMSKLGRLAALYNLAVVITCQTVTRMRAGAGAVLLPALSGTEWDNGIATKLVLFRDWAPAHFQQPGMDAERLRSIRFVGVEKLSGRTSGETGSGTVVPFVIEDSGSRELGIASGEVALQHLTSPVRPPKRAFTEIADSEDDLDSDELYGWEEQDAVAAEGLVTDEASITVGTVDDSTVDR